MISFAGAIFPLLLCPVYVNFISRMGLAWSLDRQLPEWFGEVNERMRAPLNAIIATLGITALFLWLQNFAVLPHSIAPPTGKLNLVATLWFSIFMAALTWIMPGVNAILIRFRRTGPGAQCSLPQGPAVARTRLARVPAHGSTGSRLDQADLGQRHRQRHGPASTT